MDVGGVAVEAEPSRDSILLHLVAVRQMAAEGQSDKMASDIEMYMKKRVYRESAHCHWSALTWMLPNGKDPHGR